MYDIFEELLNENQVTASVVSRATGISSSCFCDWKKGRSKPKTDKLIKIADFFGVDVGVFFRPRVKENDQLAEDVGHYEENPAMRSDPVSPERREQAPALQRA